MGGGLEGGCMRAWGVSRLHRRDLVCLEGWGLHAWKILGLLGGFGASMHGVCLEVLGLACMEGFGFAWRFWGLHAWKALALLGGFGVCMHGKVWVCLEGLRFACMKDLGFACRIWGLHAWKALGLLGGFGVCMHESFGFAWRFGGLHA